MHGDRPSPPTNSRTYATAHGPLVFGDRCLLMGILNVTPDSFSDGARYADAGAAAGRAFELAAEGADVIDVGPESTRPGAVDVAADEQIRRAIPAITECRRRGLTLPLSIDTRWATVAAAALDAGADIVNDISGARHDPAMPRLLAQRRVPFVIMHMQGTPQTMQNAPRYRDVVAEVAHFFIERAEALCHADVDVGQMLIDPGIGFGKSMEHNLRLLGSIGALRGPWPVLAGPSRKSFLGKITGDAEPSHRLMGTAAAVAQCALAGVEMVRVHDVAAMRKVVDACHAIRTGEAPPQPDGSQI